MFGHKILSIYRLRREAEQVARQLEAAAAETRRLREEQKRQLVQENQR